jgi:protein ImuA
MIVDMKLPTARAEVFQQLQRQIRSLQGYDIVSEGQRVHTGLGIIEQAFPERSFPVGAVHEFISSAPEDGAATNGFLAGLLQGFIGAQGTCLWISTRRTIFPPALKAFGIAPERIIFIDVLREKEGLWAIEEALKCKTLAAVVGELKEVSFTESRRLQLAVEKSHVTGFIHRYKPRTENTTAFVSRWKIKSLPSVLEDGMPGVGFPRWQVQLQRVRNGKPGSWQVEWTTNGFRQVPLFTPVSRQGLLKTA